MNPQSSAPLSPQDLYTREGILHLDGRFLAFLREANSAIAGRLEHARANPAAVDAKDHSQLLLDAAPFLEDFLARLFAIEPELAGLRRRHSGFSPVYEVKRQFVQRKALAKATEAQAASLDGKLLTAQLEALIGEPLTEDAYAAHVNRWLAEEAVYQSELDLAAQYAVWAAMNPEGRRKHKDGLLFKRPHKVDPYHLVPVESITLAPAQGEPAAASAEAVQLTPERWRHREGFALTDAGMSLHPALDQAHYCIKCHNQSKDSCSHGLTEKTGEYKKSVFGVTLAGCPLDEKISEMNLLKQEGFPIGALAVATVDNPMAAGTGHRICNDCMKACIFQKQEPVDIPQIETRSLKDVLELPWGFEIYSLLTRWNPLNIHRPVPKAPSGYKVLVVGLGPAGFTLAHHLMNDGHMVAGVDGLKIEPLPESISGVDPLGRRVPFELVRDVGTLYEDLNDRVLAGFGGVAEYGITVRWNKNYLKLIRLLLERRAEFAMFGGIRFGGTITPESAFAMGFDHIALCMGAGKPTVVPMKNGLSRGVRQASDFLMALQLTGAAKPDSVASLQIRLPVVVIGGGLTAVDTATESMAYYVVQIEKFLARYEALAAQFGEDQVRAGWTEEDQEAGGEFLAHARAIRAERKAAASEGREPDLIRLLQSWGGVTIAYRRRLIDSPSYTLNHEEVYKALEEGISFAECLSPTEVEVDRFGAAKTLHLASYRWDSEQSKLVETGEEAVLPARTILVAAGTQPNTVLAREDGTHVVVDGKYFRALDEEGNPVKPERVTKPSASRVLTSLFPDGTAISFFGDLHPSYSGNVVKAMASAKQGYPVVTRIVGRRAPSGPSPTELLAKLNDELRATVHAVRRLTPTIVEIEVRAPRAAREFHPGQFYRLQNFERFSKRTPDTLLAMEGLALTGAAVDRERGLLSTIVLEMGGSSDLCALLEPGEPVILMGPTGTPTETPSGETAILVGGGLGNAVLFSIGQRLRAEGSRVVYFAGYKKMIDRYKVDEIERAADVVVWCCDEAPGFTPTRVQDKSIVANIVEAIAAYARGDLGEVEIPLSGAHRIIAIGSDGMMAAVARARHTTLAPYLDKSHVAIGSINSPMQCMMKEICAQCLQVHKDPATGAETVVFSCFNQDQLLDNVDFSNLRSRLQQNSVQEKLTKRWIDRCLHEAGLRRPEGAPVGR
jgi:NADPH-dependent glutamate synthase beta subunit-like oxidoreductase/NAD(P)H-flavin reductase